jgi:hypothetical protein
MSIDINTSLDYLLRLYELQRVTLNKRRDIEWKICIAFWTAIIIGTGFLIDKVYLNHWSIVIYMMLLFVFCFLWLGKMYRSSEEDHNWILVYKSRIEKTLNIHNTEYEYREPKWGIYLISRWWWSQLLITSILLFSSWYILAIY